MSQDLGVELYTASEIIAKKRDGKELTENEIKWFIKNLENKNIADYQAAAFLMAVFIRGLNAKETAYLTDAMLYSGDVLDLIDAKAIDKHSTGGVGDKTSFILAPIAASLGVVVPMIAGRGLGHTGGTVDKIESIQGFNTSLGTQEFLALLKDKGIAMIGQTAQIAPADKLLYSLRDVTATIDSVPLITASIMSKKLAEGTSGLVLDIKTGQGAFMNTKARAKELKESILETASRFGKNMMVTITDMNQPLGNAVGNSLEIIESLETLKGNGPKDLTELSAFLAGGMVYLAGLAKSHKQGIKMSLEAIKNGSAFKKFVEMIEAQGGDSRLLYDYDLFPLARQKTEVLALENGYISGFDNKEIGFSCVALGGGRLKTNDKIDFGVGFIFHAKLGSKVKKGQKLLTIFHHDHQIQQVEEIKQKFEQKMIKITKTKVFKVPPLIYETKVVWSKPHAK